MSDFDRMPPRLTLQLTSESIDSLEKLRENMGMASKTDVIRESLKLYSEAMTLKDSPKPSIIRFGGGEILNTAAVSLYVASDLTNVYYRTSVIDAKPKWRDRNKKSEKPSDFLLRNYIKEINDSTLTNELVRREDRSLYDALMRQKYKGRLPHGIEKFFTPVQRRQQKLAEGLASPHFSPAKRMKSFDG